MVIRIVLALVAVLSAAASASGQEPKVWTDADLAKPLPKLQREADPAVLAAMKARAEYIPMMGSGAAFFQAGFSSAAPPPASMPGSVESLYAKELALERATRPREPLLYASQPLYPFVTVVYSNNRPYLRRPSSRPAPCPVPPVFLGRR